MNEKTQALLNLVKENPDLPVVPMVDYEVVPEDAGRWMGSFGHCYVGEYTCFNDRFYDDRDDFEEDYYDRNQEELNEMFGYNPKKIDEVATKQLDEYLHKVSDEYFTKAIIVNIDLPEE